MKKKMLALYRLDSKGVHLLDLVTDDLVPVTKTQFWDLKELETFLWQQANIFKIQRVFVIDQAQYHQVLSHSPHLQQWPSRLQSAARELNPPVDTVEKTGFLSRFF